MRTYFTYMLTNKNKTVLYVGMTNNITRRVLEHKNRANPKCFTARYNVDRLVWIDVFYTAWEAIAREKQLKAGSRAKKEALINQHNPEWEDLFEKWQRM
ncbi:MAG: GIY-YIG nuclease family protein [Saprospiraceae bacterium]|nr:GIY-YIG nuclease family protein [Saprospiraceae bacterium]